MRLSQELGIKIFQIAATAQSLAEGATVPLSPATARKPPASSTKSR